VTLLQQPPLRSRLGEGAARAVARFGVAGIVSTWEDLYASSAHPGVVPAGRTAGATP
jgi:hypothetical protein